MPSGTGSTCYRGPKSGGNASQLSALRAPNFSYLDLSFGFLLTEPAKKPSPVERRQAGSTAPALSPRESWPVHRALIGTPSGALSNLRSPPITTRCPPLQSKGANGVGGARMIVALLNQKGGVGKTTLALHLAGCWAAPGQACHPRRRRPARLRARLVEQRAKEGLPRLFGVIGLARDTLHREAPELARDALISSSTGRPGLRGSCAPRFSPPTSC